MSKDFPKTGEGGTAAPAEQPAKAAAPDASLATPLEHAKALKLVRTHERSARVNNEPATFDEFSPQHAAAAALHGWKEHEHHEGKPIRLSTEAYKAALHAAFNPITRALGKDGKPTGEPIDSHEAAAKGVPTFTDYEPHTSALSPHKGKGL